MRKKVIRRARGGLLLAAASLGLTGLAAPAFAQGYDPGAVLTENLRVLDGRPNDFNALIAAGNAAVDVGDYNAAAGLFGRASDVAADRPEPQAGMGRVMANMGDPGPAIGYFTEALRRGGDLTGFAVDRGLAKDLLGDTSGAQADYRMGLGRQDDAKARRRLALSLAIDGERTAALAFLQPLINQGDPGARRVRAFVLALTGDLDGARNAIEREMPGSSTQLAPFLQKLPIISNAQKAAAVHLGMFPDASEIKLAERSAPVIARRVENVPPAPPPAAREERQEDRRSRRSRSEPKVERNLQVQYEPVEKPALTVTYESMEPAETAPQAAPVRQVELPPARAMELPSQVAQQQGPERTDTRSGERLASIDQLLNQPVSSTPLVPPAMVSTPKYESRPQPKYERVEEKVAEAAPPPPKPKPRPAPPKPDIGTAGTWWVQLAGGSRADAMSREWRRMQSEAGSLLSGQKPHVTEGKSYFRLLVGPFSTRDNAQELTNKLRGNGIDVFTYKRAPEQLKITPL